MVTPWARWNATTAALISDQAEPHCQRWAQPERYRGQELGQLAAFLLNQGIAQATHVEIALGGIGRYGRFTDGLQRRGWSWAGAVVSHEGAAV